MEPMAGGSFHAIEGNKEHWRNCVHCSTPFLGTRRGTSEFCCSGCETVFEILRDEGLPSYRDLNAGYDGFQPRRAVSSKRSDYLFLDDPDYLETVSSSPDQLNLYLEGVHCAACLWIVESLPKMVPGIRSARLSLGDSVVHLEKESGVSVFSEAASTLALLGYQPHPIAKRSDRLALQKNEDRKSLIQIGVAAVSAGNVMLLAFAVYGGMEGPLARWFGWLSLALASPALTYSAWPIYRSAWYSFRSQKISIDLPIALALVGGSFMGGLAVVGLGGALYFDSLTTLVFLLLSSRHFLKALQRRQLNAGVLYDFLVPQQTFIWREGGRVARATGSVALEDTVSVEAKEKISVDGIVVQGEAWADLSALTGESKPVKISVGDVVFCGCSLLMGTVLLKPTALGEETRMGRLAKEVERNVLQGSAQVSQADDWAQIFLGAMVLLSGVAAVTQGWESALALLIVACPCAFALATPLALIRGLSAASRRGVLIKSGKTLEDLSSVTSVTFDKTGTLTHGEFEVLGWKSELPEPQFRQWVCALEKPSLHPIADSLLDWAESRGPLPLVEASQWKAVPARGVFGEVEGRSLHLGPVSEEDTSEPQDLYPGATLIGLKVDGVLSGWLALGDRIRAEARPALEAIEARGLAASIASGDGDHSVQSVANALKVETFFARETPESKASRLGSKDLFVGDGANDGPALAAAGVGVAVRGSLELSLRAASVHLHGASIEIIPGLFKLSSGVLQLIHRNFLFAVIYNLIGVSLVFAGWVSPLMAAVLMPLSATTVFLSTAWGNRSIRGFERGEIQ